MINGKNALLKKIQALSFMKVETELFLDTHPDCSAALENYKDTLEKLDELMTEYQNKYGPLFAEGVVGDRWTWVDGKWPWQAESEDDEMWVYERKLQYPVKLKNTNPKLAAVILSQLGGPDGELGAATRYLNQRYSMKDGKVIGILTDVGSEELGHAEMVAAIVHQLTKNLTPDEIKAAGMDKYFVDHTLGIYPASADGVPFTTAYVGIKGDPVADLNEDLAAEQKARVTYDNILRLSDDPDVNDVIKFLRQREIVHYQRFGEALRHVTEGLDKKNYYAFNPSYRCKRK